MEDGQPNTDTFPSQLLWLSTFRYQKSRENTSHYRQVSNIRPTLVGNLIGDHSDVVGASPVGAAPTTSSFSA